MTRCKICHAPATRAIRTLDLPDLHLCAECGKGAITVAIESK